MKKVMMWFLLSCKRYLKRASFLLLLILLPLGAFLMSGLEKKGENTIRIAVYTQTDGINRQSQPPLEQRLEDSLVGDGSTAKQGMFTFYRCASEQQLKDEVAARRAECGYVISAGLEEKLNQKKYKRSISVYSAPSTVTASLSTETVFAALMEIYDRQLLEEYTASGRAFDALDKTDGQARDEAAAQAGALYDKWYKSGGIFHFEYAYAGDGEKTEADGTKARIFPVRGLVAVYVYITGLYAAVVLGTDEKRGLFQSLSYRLRQPCRIASMAAPVALAALSGMLALWVSGSARGAGSELAAITVYGVCVVFFGFLLKGLFKSAQVLCCTIPFFIMGSLLFCPVFIDAGQWVAGADQLGRLFLPYYYLKIFGI